MGLQLRDCLDFSGLSSVRPGESPTMGLQHDPYRHAANGRATSDQEKARLWDCNNEVCRAYITSILVRPGESPTMGLQPVGVECAMLDKQESDQEKARLWDCNSTSGLAY